MKNLLLFIRTNLFNGLNGFMIFGLYGLFISPALSDTIEFEQKNLFVAYFGFFMLLIEPIALFIKLKNARIRSALKRKAFKKRTGINHVPITSKVMLFGFFARIILRTVAVGICTNALGIHDIGTQAHPLAVAILLGFIFLDICFMGLIYMKSDFFQEYAHTSKGKFIDEKAYKAWNEKHIPGYHTVKSYWFEVISDMVLQVYAVMLITAFIDYTNAYGLEEMRKKVLVGIAPWDAASDMLMLFFFLLVGAIMPIRIAYWIEDSLTAFTKKERTGQLLLFAVVTIFLFVPGILEYKLHYGNLSEAAHSFVSSIWMNLVLTVGFLTVVTSIRAVFFKENY